MLVQATHQTQLCERVLTSSRRLTCTDLGLIHATSWPLPRSPRTHLTSSPSDLLIQLPVQRTVPTAVARPVAVALYAVYM